jgi:hypothetical protein
MVAGYFMITPYLPPALGGKGLHGNNWGFLITPPFPLSPLNSALSDYAVTGRKKHKVRYLITDN